MAVFHRHGLNSLWLPYNLFTFQRARALSSDKEAKFIFQTAPLKLNTIESHVDDEINQIYLALISIMWTGECFKNWSCPYGNFMKGDLKRRVLLVELCLPQFSLGLCSIDIMQTTVLVNMTSLKWHSFVGILHNPCITIPLDKCVFLLKIAAMMTNSFRLHQTNSCINSCALHLNGDSPWSMHMKMQIQFNWQGDLLGIHWLVDWYYCPTRISNRAHKTQTSSTVPTIDLNSHPRSSTFVACITIIT